jgi:hypothetical protein
MFLSCSEQYSFFYEGKVCKIEFRLGVYRMLFRIHRYVAASNFQDADPLSQNPIQENPRTVQFIKQLCTITVTQTDRREVVFIYSY